MSNMKWEPINLLTYIASYPDVEPIIDNFYGTYDILVHQPHQKKENVYCAVIQNLEKKINIGFSFNLIESQHAYIQSRRNLFDVHATSLRVENNGKVPILNTFTRTAISHLMGEVLLLFNNEGTYIVENKSQITLEKQQIYNRCLQDFTNYVLHNKSMKTEAGLFIGTHVLVEYARAHRNTFFSKFPNLLCTYTDFIKEKNKEKRLTIYCLKKQKRLARFLRRTVKKISLRITREPIAEIPIAPKEPAPIIETPNAVAPISPKIKPAEIESPANFAMPRYNSKSIIKYRVGWKEANQRVNI